MNTLASLVALCLVPGVGGVTLQTLLDRFGSVEAILSASTDDLQATPGIGPRIAAAIRAVDVAQTAAEMAAWQEEGLAVITRAQPCYPPLLFGLRDSPPILFCRGTLTAADARAISIVGTRHPARASRHFAERLSCELAARGWTIVSGLAWGIDHAAHTGALRGGRTIAVLGSGLRAPLPPEKSRLAAAIIQRGALLSEVHPDTLPNPAALVARNRLIAGMSAATIVVEAGERSGSLHAARFAAKQQRARFAVDNGRAGNTALLRDGAQPISPDAPDWDALHEQLVASLPT